MVCVCRFELPLQVLNVYAAGCILSEEIRRGVCPLELIHWRLAVLNILFSSTKRVLYLSPGDHFKVCIIGLNCPISWYVMSHYGRFCLAGSTVFVKLCFVELAWHNETNRIVSKVPNLPSCTSGSLNQTLWVFERFQILFQPRSARVHTMVTPCLQLGLVWHVVTIRSCLSKNLFFH